MMEKSLVCLLLTLCVCHEASNNHDNTSQSSDDNKLTSLLFRQAQDMGYIMADVKTLIMLQSQEMAQQQREMNDMKTLINLQTQQLAQQQRDLNEIKSLVSQQSEMNNMKTLINLQTQQIIQQQCDLKDIKSLISQQMKQCDTSEVVWKCTGTIYHHVFFLITCNLVDNRFHRVNDFLLYPENILA